MTTPESALVNASLTGDASAFAKLYELYADRLYRYHYYRTFHKETAEDLTSQTFTQALEHLESYKESKGSFSAWIYRIARNLLIDHTRIHARQIDIQDGWDLLQDPRSMNHSLEQRHLLEQVQKYLKTLAADQRELLILRLWDERSYAEIAEILGKNEAACKMTVSRTLSRLRKQMPLTVILFMLMIPSTYGLST